MNATNGSEKTRWKSGNLNVSSNFFTNHKRPLTHFRFDCFPSFHYFWFPFQWPNPAISSKLLLITFFSTAKIKKNENQFQILKYQMNFPGIDAYDPLIKNHQKINIIIPNSLPALRSGSKMSAQMRIGNATSTSATSRAATNWATRRGSRRRWRISRRRRRRRRGRRLRTFTTQWTGSRTRKPVLETAEMVDCRVLASPRFRHQIGELEFVSAN